ncbi:phage integrase family protein [Noviherbaspirillum malthae]|uniref:phage integrase family protein n=1 Tax=Noviherbaspirillum malthae TaxID=1260987 RepID=UPI00188EF9E0|nr:phage integrase family protein [Noviherbaspirillum malthae]
MRTSRTFLPTPSNAYLFLLAPEKLAIDNDAAIPTLEEYREQHNPHEFYTEDELIALFTDEYGRTTGKQTRRLERNRRLRTKQLHALVQLEALVGADPKPTDGVDGWHIPVLAQRLRDAGIRTLSELVATINAEGYRWYSKVPRISEKAAAQITKWLTEPSVSGPLGISLHPYGVVKRRDLPGSIAASRLPETDIVPLEHFVLPAELNGAPDTNRGERPLLSARNDLDAINAWLATCKPASYTPRSYRKECERFLLWAILKKGKPVS